MLAGGVDQLCDDLGVEVVEPVGDRASGTTCADGCTAVRRNRWGTRSIAACVAAVTWSSAPGPSPTTTMRGPDDIAGQPSGTTPRAPSNEPNRGFT